MSVLHRQVARAVARVRSCTASPAMDWSAFLALHPSVCIDFNMRWAADAGIRYYDVKVFDGYAARVAERQQGTDGHNGQPWGRVCRAQPRLQKYCLRRTSEEQTATTTEAALLQAAPLDSDINLDELEVVICGHYYAELRADLSQITCQKPCPKLGYPPCTPRHAACCRRCCCCWR
jgi:hypothetical protein